MLDAVHGKSIESGSFSGFTTSALKYESAALMLPAA
jgi:hypothetical protein